MIVFGVIISVAVLFLYYRLNLALREMNIIRSELFSFKSSFDQLAYMRSKAVVEEMKLKGQLTEQEERTLELAKELVRRYEKTP